MDEGIFRAYSIRGIAGKTLTAADMFLLGQAVGTVLGQAGLTSTVMGHDYRTSSPELAHSLQEGLLSTGMHVVDIGFCHTPLLNFSTDYYRAGAGLMVTASHNPPEHNGLKIRTDHSLEGDELKAIYRVCQEGHFRQGQGAIVRAQPLETYLETICRRAELKHPLHLVVDAGHGAAGPVAPDLLTRLGCHVIPLDCEPDGRFPNRPPDPTVPGALDDLVARVCGAGADAGIAYDGDADRIVMVDETGRTVRADLLLALLAREVLAAHPGSTVVYELSCTRALPETVEALGGKAIPCPVGYAFVHEMMHKTGALLGGEASGHLFFADPDFTFDDAMLATAKLVALLSRSEKPFSALLAGLPQYVLSPDRRFPCPDDAKDAVVAQVRDWFTVRSYEVGTLDGVRVTFEDGWALFRASNTQPAVTLRCEARAPASLAEIERLVLETINQALGNL